jgi:hypothetical protein
MKFIRPRPPGTVNSLDSPIQADFRRSSTSENPELTEVAAGKIN